MGIYAPVNQTNIGSGNGLSPGPHRAITRTNAGILLIGPLGTSFDEIVIEIHAISFKKRHLQMSSGKRRPFCLGINVLRGPRTQHNKNIIMSRCLSTTDLSWFTRIRLYEWSIKVVNVIEGHSRVNINYSFFSPFFCPNCIGRSSASAHVRKSHSWKDFGDCLTWREQILKKCDVSICVLLWYERNWIIMNNCSYGYSLQHFMSFCTKSSYFLVTVLRLGFEQATSHYPNQWWPSSLTYICVTGPKWVKLQTHCHHSCKSLCVNKTHIQDEHFHHDAWWLVRITHTKITILMIYSIDWWLWYSWDVFHICRWNDERSPHWTGFRRRIKHELIPKFMLNTKIAE